MTPMRLADRYPNKPNLKGPTIDWYPHAEATRPSNECTLYDLIDGIRGEKFAEPVAKIRALIAAGDKKAADVLKKKLPAVSISGCVDGRRRYAAQEGRFTHSGLLQIDLDAKDNIGWSVDEMREALQADPRMVAVFISASGEGVKGIARIAQDVGKHKAAFLAAEAHFKSLKLTIDPACKDPVRLCFVSHDPLAWLRMDTDEQFEPVELAVVEEPDDDTDDEEPPPRAPRHRISPTGKLILRESSGGLDMTPALVADMLRVIPPRPPYDEWLKIASAVWDALGEADGTAALCAWSPEEKEGEYAAKFQKRLTDVHEATLVMRAKEHGWSRPAPASAVAKAKQASPVGDAPESVTDSGKVIPPHVFPVPNGNVGNDLAAQHIFATIAPSLRLFMREGTVFEVDDKFSDGGDGHARLAPMEPSRFASEIERFGAKVMALETTGKDQQFQWRTRLMGENHCRMLLHSSAAREHLPPICQLAASPVLVPDGHGGTKTLGRGWHPHAGGTFVTGKQRVPDMSFAVAFEILAELLCDFNFTSPADLSRAIASVLSPAMKLGRWIEDDFPLDVAEADQSQAGKSYRHKLIAAIYGETPFQITNSTGGVGSLDERVAGALIAGRPIITLENIRGRIDSQNLESAIRGVGRVTARSFRACVEVDTRPFIWQFSTNGAELTRDLANRSIITRIRKQEDGYQYKVFPEGPILAHVQANQPRFLAAVHAVVREWASQGCQQTDEHRHDFRQWARVMDWIVQKLFGLDPLLDGHRDEQLRTANPKLQWLRDVIHALLTSGHDTRTALSASDLAEASEEHDIHLPGRRNNSGESMEQAIGKLMGRIFRESNSETVTVDGRQITRQISHDFDPINRKERERKVYVIDPQPKQNHATDSTDETDSTE